MDESGLEETDRRRKTEMQRICDEKLESYFERVEVKFRIRGENKF